MVDRNLDITRENGEITSVHIKRECIMFRTQITNQRWARSFIKNLGKRKYKQAILLAQQGLSPSDIASSAQIPLQYAELVVHKMDTSNIAK